MKLNIQDIKKILPHRYPFLFVDKVEEINVLETNSHIVIKKNLSVNEMFFEGHFPGQPIMPGVIMLESAAQSCAILSHFVIEQENENKIFLLAKIDNASFKKQITPGDVLTIKSEIIKRRKSIFEFESKGYCDDILAFSCTIFGAIVDKK